MSGKVKETTETIKKAAKLKMLKIKAQRLYRKAEDFDYMSCGRTLAEYIRPDIGIARQEFNKVWDEIRELDPGAPESPFKTGP